MTMNLIECLQKIQNLNKKFHEKKPLSIDQRKDFLEKTYEVFCQKFSEYDTHFANSYYQSILQQIPNEEKTLFRPTGLILAFIPSAHLAETILQLILPAVAAGAPVLFRVSKIDAEKVEGFLNFLKEEAFFNDHFDYLVSDDWPILNQVLNHPAVKAVYYAGSRDDLIKHLPSIKRLDLKKIIRTSYKNYAVILADADLPFVAQEVAKGILFGGGVSPFAIHKIYLLESVAKDFLTLLEEALLKSSDADGEVALPTQFIDQVRADQGKIFFTSKNAALIKDLSHCSVLQQEDYTLPAVIVDEVKYQYQIGKYANVSDLAQVAFIFGSEEKALKLTKDLSAEYFVLNRFTPLYDQLMKQRNFQGIIDQSPFGEFFSDRQFVL